MRKKITRYQAHYQTFRKKRVRKIHAAAKHPFAVPVFTLLGLLVLTAGIYFYFNRGPSTIDPNIVVISHDKQQQIVSSEEPTVGALLTKLNIKVNSGDVVEPALDTPIQQDDFRINIYRAVPVEIVDQGQTSFALSAQTSERSAALEAGVTIYPEDKLTRKPITDFVASGAITEQVLIDRATQVNVNLYGAAVVMRTHATTVQGLLDERNVKLKPQDQVTPAPATPITPGMQLSIVRNGLSTVTVQEDIPAPTQNITDNSLAYGTSAVRQQGTPGKRAVTYQVNTQNGVEIGRTPIQSTVVSQPVTQIVVIGTNLSGIKGDMALAGIASGDYQYADYIVSKESGWNPAARNASSGAYGLCQALPGSKMADTSRGGGPDWETNPITQLRWCNNYAVSRYGGWANAYSYWLRNRNW